MIAPTLTPRKPGERIMTDRRDTAKSVRLFRAGELTAIHVPDETEEGVLKFLFRSTSWGWPDALSRCTGPR